MILAGKAPVAGELAFPADVLSLKTTKNKCLENRKDKYDCFCMEKLTIVLSHASEKKKKNWSERKAECSRHGAQTGRKKKFEECN